MNNIHFFHSLPGIRGTERPEWNRFFLVPVQGHCLAIGKPKNNLYYPETSKPHPWTGMLTKSRPAA